MNQKRTKEDISNNHPFRMDFLWAKTLTLTTKSLPNVV